MMADTKRGVHPFAPLVLDDAGRSKIWPRP